jgi:hypothetical protein
MSTAGDSLDSSNVSIEMAEGGLNTPNRTRRKFALSHIYWTWCSFTVKSCLM